MFGGATDAPTVTVSAAAAGPLDHTWQQVLLQHLRKADGQLGFVNDVYCQHSVEPRLRVKIWDGSVAFNFNIARRSGSAIHIVGALDKATTAA
jgi:hypothetical protein